MLFGQADGISRRTIEIMEAFNCSETVVKEAYWLNQNAYWEPDDAQPENIRRAHKIPDARLGLSEFTHSVVNQALIHDLLLAGMKNAPARLVPVYNRRLIAVQLDSDHSQDLDRHVVTASFERVGSDPAETADVAEANPAIDAVRARFIVGCDGARSTVRRSLDIALHGDSASKAWGVMRLYVELELLDADLRVASLDIEADDIIAAAQRILHADNRHIGPRDISLFA